ncbi:uncharacterized protein ASCRUDRAFT_105181 [Ascoidea rubescens DSM 1968]|uniref:Amino acid permease/ SLC12A domain-containing protein n=1 Tax=Ascoidea rubescens DSM 1968 TaxID=1344418 RepID=A0A1D2VS25_9ASCO|nr:hypothetical protein ASCRUDRAFT_105181 [Ascoidea rubescens DSM 1968]ODV64422.1 hypothetical protein ASCRUDRAFT_105181 [Ascoidea rubescens DSM 1968]
MNQNFDSIDSFFKNNAAIDNDSNYDMEAQTKSVRSNNINTSNTGNDSLASTSTSSTIYRQVSYELHQVNSPQPLAVTSGHQLNHSLRAIEIASICLCSVIGTGLLVGSARFLAASGPVSLLIAFTIMGFVTVQVLNALCEMSTYIPIPNGYSGYTSRYVDPSLGFALAYCYLLESLVVGPNQLTAGALVILYWVGRNTINPAVWITVFLTLVVLFNGFIRIGKFSLLVTAFVITKFVVITGVIILLIVIMFGGAPSNDVIGFRYWKENPFAEYSEKIDGSTGCFVSFLSVLVGASFSYLGTETIVVAVGESVNPRSTIPKARKLVAYPLITAYISVIALIGLCVPYYDSALVSSEPYSSAVVVAIENALIQVLPHIFNGAILIFVFSAATSSFYVATRVLYGLSVSGESLKIFSKTNKYGIPYYAVIFVAVFDLLSYMNITEQSSEIFGYLVDTTSSFGIILWDCILLTHICFIKAFKTQGLDRKKELHYYAAGSPYTTIIALCISLLVTIIKNFTVFLSTKDGFQYGSFISGYIGIPIFLLMFTGHKFYYKTEFIKSEDADLYFYKDYVDAEEEEYKKNLLEEQANVLEDKSSKVLKIKKLLWEWFI